MKDQPLMGHAAFHYDPSAKKPLPDIVNAAGVLSAIIAERDQLRADLTRFTSGGLLNVHAICDQRDKAVADLARERARWEWLNALGKRGGAMVFRRDAWEVLNRERACLGTGPTLAAATTDAMAKEAK